MQLLFKTLIGAAIILVIFVLLMVCAMCKINGAISKWEREHEADSI